ncbi:MAG: HD domain-containing protein [Thermoguttaceae bacterium]|jgi:(p)ppGpp synthase/HD superfamily hydrolase
METSATVLELAIALAVRCHAGQWRKYTIGGHRIPYITHPTEVMKTVWQWGAGSPAMLSAAILHDALEDSDLTYKQLARDFGEEIAGMVKELTHDPKNDGDKGEYLRSFAAASVPALLIKLADRYCNIHDCLFTDRGRVKAYLGKSAVLIETMHARLAEISKTFGEEVGREIVAAYQGLQDTIEAIP